MKQQAQAKKYLQLLKAAKVAKRFSYSPYSKFRVGAALLTEDGKIISGCNIENSSFSLTICAERTAIFKAVSEDRHSFKAIAVVADSDDYTSPCGACRQVLMDLAGDIDVILTRNNGSYKVLKLSQLLPMAFNGKILLR